MSTLHSDREFEGHGGLPMFDVVFCCGGAQVVRCFSDNLRAPQGCTFVLLFLCTYSARCDDAQFGEPARICSANPRLCFPRAHPWMT